MYLTIVCRMVSMSAGRLPLWYVCLIQTNITIMKKLAYLMAALLCCPLVQAQQPAAPAAAEITVAEAEAAVGDLIAVMNETLDILEQVKDKASADAAAEKIAAVKPRMLAAQTTFDKVSSLDEATQEKLAMKLLPAMFMLAPRMEKVTEALETQKFYGSDALKTVLEDEGEGVEATED